MDSTIPRSWQIDAQIRREDLYGFHDSAERYFAGELKRSDFMEISGRFGCIPSRETDTLFFHVPIRDGRFSEEIARYLLDAIRDQELTEISFTTEPGVLLHGLQLQPLCELLERAFDLGIFPAEPSPNEQASVSDAEPESSPLVKQGDGGSITHPRIRPQSQEGLFGVCYHPVAGFPETGEFCRLVETVFEITGARLRLTKEQELWIDNLTSDEAERMLNLTGSSAQTPFERSIVSVDESEDRAGAPDPRELLEASIRAVYRAQIPEEALPTVIFSDFPLSKKEVAKLPKGQLVLCSEVQEDQPACRLYLAEPMQYGRGVELAELALLSDEQVPAFFTALGKQVALSNQDYDSWYAESDQELRILSEAFKL